MFSFTTFIHFFLPGGFLPELISIIFIFLLTRERTVASLISLGAAPGLLTDPTPKYPAGKTPADLASDNGHKGISGYLAESALSAHLKILDLDAKEGKAADTSAANAVQTVSERTATPIKDGDPDRLSLKDSLAAVCNATQAAARIHQVFRVQSFQRKQLKEYSDDKFGLSDERALSLITVKTQKAGQYDDDVHAAAVRIQNKFRGWKGRKEFLIIRKNVVKIQVNASVCLFGIILVYSLQILILNIQEF